MITGLDHSGCWSEAGTGGGAGRGASAVPGDVADVDALMAWRGEKADEAPSAQKIELPEPALPVDRPADFHGVAPEGCEFGGEPLHLCHYTGRQPVRYVLRARV